jgi:dethiobiotin synthetase
MSVHVFTGTGTGIGKTHLATAFLYGAPLGVRSAGFKPFESGITPLPGTSALPEGEDEARLRAASRSTFVPPIRLRAPLAPPMAAFDEGIVLSNSEATQRFRAAMNLCDELVLELAGGLFSPFTHGLSNADWLSEQMAALGGGAIHIYLVAPDRLGVLHDVTAALRAARATGLVVDAVLLSAPATPDLSTGRNQSALAADPSNNVHSTHFYSLARADVAALADGAAVRALWKASLPRSSSTESSQ